VSLRIGIAEATDEAFQCVCIIAVLIGLIAVHHKDPCEKFRRESAVVAVTTVDYKISSRDHGSGLLSTGTGITFF
jgi:hypothetical protein